MLNSVSRHFLFAIAISLLIGCSGSGKKLQNQNYKNIRTVPFEFSSEAGNETGAEIFTNAQKYLGTPYKYGGNDVTGFDCSGLVQYSHRLAKINIPRTTAAQYQVAESVAVSDLMQGDVVFFRLSRYKVSHVGIYAGQGWFIHAPSSGKTVMYSSLDEPYWQSRMVKTGRFY